MTSPDPYWRDFFARAEHALLLLAYSTSTALFLIALWIGVSWLIRSDQNVAAGVLIASYILIALPVFLAQLAALADLLFAFITGDGVSIPVLTKLADGVAMGWPLRALGAVLTTISPLSSLSAWAWSVVLPALSAAELVRSKHRAEAAALALTWRRLRKRA